MIAVPAHESPMVLRESSPDGVRATRLAAIVAVVRREGLGSVFLSQVVRPMRRIAEAGFDVDIVVLCPVGQLVKQRLRERWEKIIGSLPQCLNGRLHRLCAPPSRFEWRWAEQFVLRQTLRKLARRGRPLIVQCRNAATTNLALDVKGTCPAFCIVFDCRGLEDEEFHYQYRDDKSVPFDDIQREAERLLGMQRRATRESDAIFCVSRAMADHLVRKHEVDHHKCEIVPTCVDVDHFGQAASSRSRLRAELGFGERLVVTYCGSLHAWQMPEESLEVFTRIRRWQPDAFFLGITTHPDALRKLIARQGISEDRTRVLSVLHNDVPCYLAAADCGFLLRESSPVNQVASPVKFGEYLASGTPVIMSDGIGDYSELARRENVGVVLPMGPWNVTAEAALKTFVDAYLHNPASWRERCLRVARERLDYEAYLPRIAERFLRVAGGGGDNDPGVVSR
jgi:glycosyltransferase involved in cell wall biosynthesis